MAKIINAKSQIGKTEKCESETMLEFVATEHHTRVEIKQHRKRSATGHLVRDAGTWVFYSSTSSPLMTSDFMRQIADKLDELNGFELPEILKEQAL